MKKLTIIFSVIVMVTSCFTMAACKETKQYEYIPLERETKQTTETEKPAAIKIPDIVGADEQSAKNVVSAMGLVPKISYEYDDEIAEGNVVSVKSTGTEVLQMGDALDIVVSKGPRYYNLGECVGWMKDVKGIDPFTWEEPPTKGFPDIYVEEGYLYIKMFLCCKSQYDLAFYKDFGTASITDTFDKTVPIKII